MQVNDTALLDRVKEVVRNAMDTARRMSAGDSKQKGYQDYVTNVDLTIDALLERNLGALIPECPVLSEERAVAQTGHVAQYWIVDPIDGTLNMMSDLPFYGIAVALIDKDGPRLAVVASIPENRLYSADRGRGAWLDDTPLHLSDTLPSQMIVLSTGLLDRLQEYRDSARYSALRKIGKIRNLGAQALHICGVARGQFAAVASIEARVWDEAAAGLILREAGGLWTARSDAANWTEPATLMAIRAQCSIAAHPDRMAPMHDILTPVFTAQSSDPHGLLLARTALCIDRKQNMIRLNPDLSDMVTAFALASGTDTPNTWQTVHPCPQKTTRTTPLRVGLRVSDGTETWVTLTPDEMTDHTAHRIFVSQAKFDLARACLLLRGWAIPTQPRQKITLTANGQPIAHCLVTGRRHDVVRNNPLVPTECGFRANVTLEPSHICALIDGTLTLELRLMTGAQPIHIVRLPEPDPDPEALALRDLRQRVRAKAESSATGRLTKLLASEPFRRRWCLDSDSPGWHAREEIVATLIPRLTVGEELAIRLYNGDKVLCQPLEDSILARRFLTDAGDERGFLDWLDATVSEGDRVLDIGAAYGVVSRTMARKGAHVTAVEADPTSADRIRRSGQSFGTGQITLIEQAVSDTEGEVTFAGMGQSCAGLGKILENDANSSVSQFLEEVSELNQVPLKANLTLGEKASRTFNTDDINLIRIPATTIDAICTREKLSDIALMKIDIEGGELMALHGATGLLDGAFGTPPIVVFEYSKLFPMRGGSHEDVLNIFYDRDWRLYRLENGKSYGGALIEIAQAADAPKHDNLIAVPPGRDLKP